MSGHGFAWVNFFKTMSNLISLAGEISECLILQGYKALLQIFITSCLPLEKYYLFPIMLV